MNTRGSRTGFTLIELIAVVAIVAILVAAALPALRAIQATALQTAARQVGNELLLTRQYAVTKRTPVRFVLALTSSGSVVSSDKVCRAYIIVARTNNLEGVEAGWAPLQDWKFLPDGVIFSDLNGIGYNIHNTPESPGTVGTRTINVTSIGNPNGWQYFNNSKTFYLITNTISSTGATITTSVLEFSPTGVGVSGATGTGLRLAQGSVLDSSTRNLLVNDTNNWVYIEIDGVNGRIRTRFIESYN